MRPPGIEDRLMPGHWEGDLIKGANNPSAIAVLVERTTRYVLLARMPDSSAASSLAAFTGKLNSISAPMRQSLTYDQGREMARHAELARATRIRVYFCAPHSPWRWGTCENTHGLPRQYFPKGTDLCVYPQEQLNFVADALNGRRRATLNWHLPLRAFSAYLASVSHPHHSLH